MSVRPKTEKKEISHIHSALLANDFPKWMFDIPIRDKSTKKKDPSKDSDEKSKTITLPLPYVRGVSEKLQRAFKNHGIKTYHKPFNTMKSMLVNPKDKTPITKKCGVVYHIPCQDCDKYYIGETSRSLGTRLKEHLATERTTITAIREHCKTTVHAIDTEKHPNFEQ